MMMLCAKNARRPSPPSFGLPGETILYNPASNFGDFSRPCAQMVHSGGTETYNGPLTVRIFAAKIVGMRLDIAISSSIRSRASTLEHRKFAPTLFDYLDELTANNNRPWFQANKSRYEDLVLGPCQAFIRAFQPKLKKISPFFVASDRRMGGSILRIYKDTRFARDKTPYKTNVGIQFRHEMGRDIHAPGFYLHIASSECFLGAGVWHPDAEALAAVRQQIVDEPAKWRRASQDEQFKQRFELAGDSLRTAPRGYAPDHPQIEDLKRKDFIAIQTLTEQDVLHANFLDRVAESFAAAKPLMRFLCKAIMVPY